MTAPSAYTVARPSDDRQSEPANAWQEEALCREVDPELFFPEGTGADWRTPRRICAACPVKGKCLDAAMREETGQSLASRAGMRGGMTPKERWTTDQPSRDTRPAPSPGAHSSSP
ncbi:MAG: WhiB family transcriptional regulator [Micrococcales bacterium]|nr:WhiB family transcriptional regulator [Micrococcales bacterium]